MMQPLAIMNVFVQAQSEWKFILYSCYSDLSKNKQPPKVPTSAKELKKWGKGA